MSNVVLSLDGRKEVQRPLPRRLRRATAAMIASCRNSRRSCKARGNKAYYMRGTFTHCKHRTFTNDIFHMADLGFTELSMEPVVCAPGRPLPR